MKTILRGKACQFRECAAFAVDRCRAHGLSANVEPIEKDVGVSIRFLNGLIVCGIDILADGNDLLIESTAEKVLILSDPAPISPFLSWMIGDIISRVRAKRILKAVHSEIEKRFTCPQ
jgi:hypothetical protein